MRAFFSALSVGLALMVMGTSASAVPFSYRFESPVDAGTVGLSASQGDPASITVTLDNGGASIANQTWTAADLVSVVFDINNGAATTSFFSPFDGGLSNDFGSFETNAAGNLISAPTNWSDLDITADFTASFPVSLGLQWSVNGGDPVLSGGVFLLLTDAQGMLDPANWSLVTATALTLPPTLLLLLVGLGGVALLRRAGPGTTGGFAEARGA